MKLPTAHCLLTVGMAMLLCVSPLLAEPTAADDSELAPLASFTVGSVRNQIFNPPPEIAKLVAIEFASLESHRGVALDINHNGVLDYIFSDNPGGCGVGGCPLILIDGSQKKIIGRFYGNPLYILKKGINGRPIIEVFRSEGETGGVYSSYIYNGKEYTEASSFHLEGASLKKLQDKLNSDLNVPKGNR